MYTKNPIISLLILAVVILTGCSFYAQKSGEISFLTLKTPENVTIKGDSAKFVGRSKYEVYATVTNKTSKDLVYMPLFGLIKDKSGNKIAMALGNTGRIIKAGNKASVVMETVILKDANKPSTIELYSE